ncbi:MAG: glucodextranase DOMON-like domain-containing protein [Pseudomonadota bacterium]
MKQKTLIHALALATGILFAASAQAVEFTDARGDDNGPGNYTYPTDGVYKAGSFDLTKFTAKKKGNQVEFAIDVNSALEDPWGMGVGFAVQMAFVFIKNKDGGHSEGLPGLNVQFAPGHEWNKVVVLSPQKKGRVVGEAKSKAAKMADDIVVPNLTRGSSRTIKASVPLAELGGDGNVDGWSFQVVMQSNEGFPAEGDLLTRKVNEYEGQHRWGGGTDGDCDPHVIDLIESADASQKDMLAYTCGADGKAEKMATLKMIKK